MSNFHPNSMVYSFGEPFSDSFKKICSLEKHGFCGWGFFPYMAYNENILLLNQSHDIN